jgi:hypothetical protein
MTGSNEMFSIDMKVVAAIALKNKQSQTTHSSL